MRGRGPCWEEEYRRAQGNFGGWWICSTHCGNGLIVCQKLLNCGEKVTKLYTLNMQFIIHQLCLNEKNIENKNILHSKKYEK